MIAENSILYFVGVGVTFFLALSFFVLIISFWFSVVIFSRLRYLLRWHGLEDDYDHITFKDKIGSVYYWEVNVKNIGWIHPRIIRYLLGNTQRIHRDIDNTKKRLKTWILIYYFSWGGVIVIPLIFGLILWVNGIL